MIRDMEFGADEQAGADGQNLYEAQSRAVIGIFALYHRYYVEAHLPREMELRQVRTKCEQKYNSLRYVSNKKELARREEDEIDWLNKEGVLAPDEKRQGGRKKHKKKKKDKEHD